MSDLERLIYIKDELSYIFEYERSCTGTIKQKVYLALLKDLYSYLDKKNVLEDDSLEDITKNNCDIGKVNCNICNDETYSYTKYPICRSCKDNKRKTLKEKLFKF